MTTLVVAADMKASCKITDSQRGFTLTELIIVIVIMGVLSAVVTPLIANKFSAVAQSTERAQWVQDAEYALFHLRQDLAISVPNSVFIADSNDKNVEFLTISVDSDLYAARYRDKNYNPYDNLKLNNESSFDLFIDASDTPEYVSVGTSDAVDLRTDWQNLLSSGSSGSVAKVSSSSASSAENASPILNVTLDTSSGNHTFSNHSPYYRAYFFEGPVGYECDTSAGFLYRVSNYTSLAASSSFSTRASSAQQDRVISNLIDCQFELIGGSVYNAPSLRVMLEIGEGDESIKLIDSIMLSNAS